MKKHFLKLTAAILLCTMPLQSCGLFEAVSGEISAKPSAESSVSAISGESEFSAESAESSALPESSEPVSSEISSQPEESSEPAPSASASESREPASRPAEFSEVVRPAEPEPSESSEPPESSAEPAEERWELVFEDQFNTIDWTVWKTIVSNQPVRRAAYYTTDEEILFVQDGFLTIRTKWMDGPHGEGYYTSWLESPAHLVNGREPEGYTGFSATYGYFEIRCKCPPANGIWSAFWLMPDNRTAFSDQDVQNSGRDGAELDIMESPFHSTGGIHRTQSAIHVDGYDGRLKSAISKPFSVEDPYHTFHTYGMNWDEAGYTFYIDGQETWHTDFLNGTSEGDEYIVLSTEVGGKNDGLHPTGYESWAGDASQNDLSQHYDFVVDYVRIYQKMP